MKKTIYYQLFILLSFCLLSGFGKTTSSGEYVRETINFDFNWRFHLGDQHGANNPFYNDADWRKLNVPHDWSIEGKFSPKWASSTGYLPGGIGWYRKTFTLPESDKNKHVEIQFDGVYDNSEVWINGHYLGKRPYGFISFYYNLSPYLHFGDQKNVIAVRVDHSHFADSRWYTGSGIDRHVWLYVTNPIHVSHWGTYITTPSVTKNSATARVITKIENDTNDKESITLKSIVIDSTGKVVGIHSSNMDFQSHSTSEFDQSISVKNPVLWSLDNPALYSVVSQVYSGSELVDSDTTAFGFRTIRFDANKGFFLNGKPTLIKGVCLHNDAGAVGSAVPEREWYRRLRLMKEMGANAIRTSHNPPAPEFLKLCDKMGFLVMDEAFDEWAIGKKKWIKGRNVGMALGAAGLGTYYSQNGYSDFFQKWAKKDLQDMVRRDRNHPSVILWSIGNEIDYPNDPYTDPTRNDYKPWRPSAYQITKIARHLYDDVKELDTTHPVTAALANMPLSNQTGYAGVLDVVGYNYQEQYYKEDHKKFPNRKMTGSENGDSYQAWLAVKDNAFIPGQFLWTGVDYIGEAGRFPNRSNRSGLVDLSDFKKPGFYFRQSLWSSKPMVYVAAEMPFKDSKRRFRAPVVESWNWGQFKGEDITVVVYTNGTSAQLFLDGKSLGTKKMADFSNHVIKWKVPYKPGVLKAVAYENGKIVAQHVLKTAGKPYRVKLVSDRADIHANKEDMASVQILVTDKNGNVVPFADNEVHVTVTGAGFNDGIGNGNSDDIESYKTDHHSVFMGKARVYIMSNGQKGTIHIEAKSSGLKSARLKIKAE